MRGREEKLFFLFFRLLCVPLVKKPKRWLKERFSIMSTTTLVRLPEAAHDDAAKKKQSSQSAIMMMKEKKEQKRKRERERSGKL